jgi:N4-(beta-N-acetylglucosaminyl)-L-asparaginase
MAYRTIVRSVRHRHFWSMTSSVIDGVVIEFARNRFVWYIEPMESHQNRRSFIKATSISTIGAVTALGSTTSRSKSAAIEGNDQRLKGVQFPVCIASGNGLRAVERAHQEIVAGRDTALAVVSGVGIVEADPNDMSVGYGGLPNEEGIVQLDASVMHGPTHKAGSVACIENIMHPAQVALKVLQTTDHVMIVGRGAFEFARAHGFKREDMLTEKARQAWLRWKQNRSSRDDWLDHDQSDWSRDGTTFDNKRGAKVEPRQADPFTYGTIHCAAVNTTGEVSACTTTSGLSYKIPGRVGDSPIIGAGMFVDNEVGAAGATGRGEAVIQSCGAFSVVSAMERGMEPTQACLHVLKKIASNSAKQKRLVDDHARPNFNATLYALRKDGLFGSACMLPGGSFAVADAQEARVIKSTPLFG